MIARFNGNVVPFADDATSTNRTVFGGATQSDAIDDNLNADFKKGWEIVGLNDNPTREDFNAMGYTLGALIAYLYEMGISEWNASQNYRANSRVIGSDGKIYKALTGTTGTPNVNHNPTSDAVNWELEFKNFVTLTGNQTIAGVKTFSSTISGSINGNAATATTLSTTRTNYKDTTDSVVVGGLMWKQFGNSHTIFDASNSTTPTGVTKNNTNPEFPWSPTFPTLMGYNGINTYGVRVDSSRYADTVTNGVYTIGNQTITGVKTFSSSPIVPTPTAGTQAVNKDYADLKVALASFIGTNQSLAGSGYQKLPGGLIIQWGRFTSTTTAWQDINFNIAFPNVVFYVGSGGTYQYIEMDNPALWTATIMTNSYFKANRSDALTTNREFCWVAIGY